MLEGFILPPMTEFPSYNFANRAYDLDEDDEILPSSGSDLYYRFNDISNWR